LTGTSRAIVHFYDQRGAAEQWIKEGKAATHRPRVSCHRFRANEVRLLFGVIAYNLGNLLRRLVLPLAIQSWSLTSLQQRPFKTGGRLIRHVRYFVLQLAESYLTLTLFRQILAADRATCVAPHVIESPTAGAGPMSSNGGSSRGVSEQDSRRDHTHENGAADGRGAARMISVNVPDRMNELTEGTVGSVDAHSGTEIGPYWKSRSI
jgi:hypothetical protein